MLFHVPDALADRFRQATPPRQRNTLVAKLIEQALPKEDDPLCQVALAVEQDSALNDEMRGGESD